MNAPLHRSYERLLRTLLQLPRRPAVVLLELYSWLAKSWANPKGDGSFWASAERYHFEFAEYYGLPLLSLRAAAYHSMRVNKDGFQVGRMHHSVGGEQE